LENRSPEKAGVGGSIPSLPTMFSIFQPHASTAGSRPLVRGGRNRQHIKGLPVFDQQFAVLPDRVREYKSRSFRFSLAG